MRTFAFFIALSFVTTAYADWFVLAEPDQSDWSEKRKATYAEFESPMPEAVVTIDSLGIEAHVFPDSLKNALEGGVSHVSGTSLPGQLGNMAIAGHRDSFFRKLENVPIGTEITIKTEDQVYTYQVSEISIVDALDVSVLEDTEENVLTLITCHPFYYQGYAPDRYIVRATSTWLSP
ncbi:MAG: class D sortase [Pseudomonadales bacterium]|nr:class D sortase [Pseudomonadales bacterium]